MMALAPRCQEAKVNSTINVTPMVDVMLVLLIIFMVITPMLQPGVPLEMAKANHPIDMSDTNNADALIVSVQRDGNIFLGSERVTGAALTQKLQERLTSRVNKTVYIRTDARARYAFLVGAVDDVRSADVDQLGLLTEQRQKAIIQ
jgi:biopolymer transport protein TolR